MKKFVIIGAGYSGLKALQWLLSRGETDVSLLESDDFPGGRANSGLHTISENFPSEIFNGDFPIESSLIRWNKTWTSFANVDWEDKSWSQILPQWNDYFVEKQRAVGELIIQENLTNKIQFNTPIQNIYQDSGGHWELQTPSESLQAQHVIWCSPMSALQLCIGKVGAQQFSCPNPKFQEQSQEFKGGLAFDWIFSKAPELNEINFNNVLLGIPVKHQSKLYLSLAISIPEKESFALKTLTYLPEDLLCSPKEVLSFQKSLRRTLRQHLSEEFKAPSRERWVVSPEIRGAIYAKPWVLKSQPRNNLFFAGEDTISSAESRFTGVEAIQASLKTVFDELEHLVGAPLSASPEDTLEQSISS